MAVALIAAKVACVWPLKTLADLASVLPISIEDVLVSVGFGALAGAALWATSSRPALQRYIWHTVLACGSLAVLYAMVNIGIYRSMGYSLNLRMLVLAKDFAQMRSSIVAHCSLGVITAMLAAPVGYAMLARRRYHIATLSRTMRMALVMVAVLWVSGAIILWAQAAPDGRVRRVGRNPHREMVTSLASRWLSDGRMEIAAPFPAGYLDDFKRAAEWRQPPLVQFTPAPRNIIVVVLESVGAQYMSLYGSPFDTTPQLSAEARNALVFDHCYAHVGYTYNERMALFYSVYPGLPWCYRPHGPRRMSPGLAGILQQRGYRTAYFSASETEWGALAYFAKDAGMQEIFGPDQLGGRRVSSWGVEDGALVDGLINWIDAAPKRPFFAIAWTDQTHDPFTLSADTKPANFLGSESLPHGDMQDRYLNAIRQVDRQLGRLFEALRARNMADDTLVVITGDHGEAFGELHEDNFGHGGAMFEENLRVPLMLWNPRLFAGGRRSQTVGGHVDINPTLAHLMGIKPPPAWQGASLFSDEHPGRAYIQTERGEYQFGVVDGHLKYMLYGAEGVGRLYDLQQDPHELQDLSAERPAVAREMHARISAFVHAEESYQNGNDDTPVMATDSVSPGKIHD